MTVPTALPRSLTLYLAAVQCLAAVSWIAYVVYLPQLAASAGVPASVVGWILVADQAVFALADLALGKGADRALRVMRTLGPWLVAITVVSGVAFVAMPMIAGTGTPAFFLALIFLWALASSVLRAPALALVAKRTPKLALPWLATLVVIGTALAAAGAPYLALMAKEVDPRWPFLVATGALVAAVVGLALAERRGALAAADDGADAEERPVEAPPSPKTTAAFFAAAALLAIGLQIHTNINTTPLYKQFAPAAALPWLCCPCSRSGWGCSHSWGPAHRSGWVRSRRSRGRRSWGPCLVRLQPLRRGSSRLPLSSSWRAALGVRSTRF